MLVCSMVAIDVFFVSPFPEIQQCLGCRSTEALAFVPPVQTSTKHQVGDCNSVFRIKGRAKLEVKLQVWSSSHFLEYGFGLV